MIIGASSTCEMWPGILKTDAGPSLLFAVETPMTGSLDTGLNPTDPAALKRAKLLQQARFFGPRAPRDHDLHRSREGMHLSARGRGDGRDSRVPVAV